MTIPTFPYMPPVVPKESLVTVYCDESRHCFRNDHPFMVIGGLWVLSDQRKALTSQIKLLCKEHNLNSELKWKKVSAKKLDAYKAIADLFMNSAEMRFRAIIVEHEKVNYEKFHGNDKELGFYKFYYQLLYHWLDNKNRYSILVDNKPNKEKDRIKILEKILRVKTSGTAWINGISQVESHETKFIQVCDLFTGAVAASYCGFESESPKKLLADYIAQKLSKKNLNFKSFKDYDPKFNLFCWEPSFK